ncbi:2,3-bisphosphoglycerate-dependent phosphoglycerate mutase [Cellulomonas sp. SG140]|uniref:2,3-bisphosphoglycerate-dependent phosphoglycerate mutase n=1 Tax=Cellulomonas sp. SG140 TaxID=2976536 RepID=UPI0021E78815|nr:2,3-bisphosphoglycerate-dependent phosphoglycerate mutase [Cellulomonas sp. SG140]HEX3005421.1 2,3-bisphosphoglycerate-dependent phosphoglycerate mutase [Angustibacter sp.]
MAGEQTRRPSGTLVLLRNGQSQADGGQVFAGLLDPHLTDVGLAEARNAGEMLRAHRIGIDLVLSSPLARALQTAGVVADGLGVPQDDRVIDARLRARGLGRLTGLAKRRALEKFGRDSYLEWRYALDGCPPPATPEQATTWQWSPPADLVDAETLRAGESLRDVIARVRPVWTDAVQPALRAGRNVLLVAHGDSLRALRAVLEDVASDRLGDSSITPAQPLVYGCRTDGRIVGPGRYVEDLDQAHDA